MFLCVSRVTINHRFYLFVDVLAVRVVLNSAVLDFAIIAE